jgi:hypothetical protein
VGAEQVQGQVVLGGEEYVEGVWEWIAGSEKEQRGLRELVKRPTWEQVIQAVERIKRGEVAEAR